MNAGERIPHAVQRHVLRCASTKTVQLAPGEPSSNHTPGVPTVSPDEHALAQRFASDLEDLAELSKCDPAAADRIVGSLVSHIRTWRPESVAPLGTLPEPGEVARDPRGRR